MPSVPSLHVTFRNMESSPAVTARLEAEFAKLARHSPEIVSGRATLAAMHRHHLHGHHYQVHLDIRIPGHEIVVSHESAARPALTGAELRPTKETEVEAPHRDAYVSIRDAFDVARRRLAETARRTRGRRCAADRT